MNFKDSATQGSSFLSKKGAVILCRVAAYQKDERENRATFPGENIFRSFFFTLPENLLKKTFAVNIGPSSYQTRRNGQYHNFADISPRYHNFADFRKNLVQDRRGSQEHGAKIMLFGGSQI